jgi:DNA polymerase-3 subunit epsilon
MELVAIDLEGTGAQDRDHEAILEIALVPIIGWQPDMTATYCTLINPQRPVPRRPWISPGLTDEALGAAPTIETVEPELAQRINGKYLVGHNVGVDWRLLHRRCPSITPAGLIDTLRLARTTALAANHSLGHLVESFRLTDMVNNLAIGSTPHRALWDTVAAALLLDRMAPKTAENASFDALFNVAGVTLPTGKPALTPQPSLFD